MISGERDQVHFFWNEETEGVSYEGIKEGF